MPDMNDFNTQIINEFRANGGKVGGGFAGATLLLLHHQGAKSGQVRVSPLAYLPVGNAYAIFGSKGGAPSHPHWYLNLKAHPDTEVEVGADTVKVTAREARGKERDEIFTRQKAAMPGFAEYEDKTKGIRQIPVILLEPRS
jgi:deazaflavin-dependent oxidoreductase (nitroreductase family)